MRRNSWCTGHEHIAVAWWEGAKVNLRVNIIRKNRNAGPLQSAAESIVECNPATVKKSRTEQRSRRSGSETSRASSVWSRGDSPNLHQVKDSHCKRHSAALASALGGKAAEFSGPGVNDADVMAAELPRHRKIESTYPSMDAGQWSGFRSLSFERRHLEGGHSWFTLDPKENFCGCGGRGPSGRHSRAALHAHALPGPGTRRSVEKCSHG